MTLEAYDKLSMLLLLLFVCLFVYISRQVNIFYTPLLLAKDSFTLSDFWLIQEVPDDQFEEDLVGRPVTHLAAAKHATGEAVYCDDIPKYAGTVMLTLRPHTIWLESLNQHA